MLQNWTEHRGSANKPEIHLQDKHATTHNKPLQNKVDGIFITKLSYVLLLLLELLWHIDTFGQKVMIYSSAPWLILRT